MLAAIAILVCFGACIVCGLMANKNVRDADMRSDTERKLLERVAIYEAAKISGVELLNLDLPQPRGP